MILKLGMLVTQSHKIDFRKIFAEAVKYFVHRHKHLRKIVSSPIGENKRSKWEAFSPWESQSNNN